MSVWKAYCTCTISCRGFMQFSDGMKDVQGWNYCLFSSPLLAAGQLCDRCLVAARWLHNICTILQVLHEHCAATIKQLSKTRAEVPTSLQSLYDFFDTLFTENCTVAAWWMHSLLTMPEQGFFQMCIPYFSSNRIEAKLPINLYKNHAAGSCLHTEGEWKRG